MIILTVFCYTALGPRPLQIVFDTSPVVDKYEAPGEIPDPQSAGLSGARPLGLGTPPPVPDTPPPMVMSKKKGMPSPVASPPKLDVEVSTFSD